MNYSAILRFPASLFLIQALLPLASMAGANDPPEYLLQNDYISLAVGGGVFNSLQIDPEGNRSFGPNLLRELMIGAPVPGLPARNYTVESSANQLALRDLTIYRPATLEYEASGYPRQILPGQRVGVAFHAATAFDRIGARFPTWHQTNSGATASLYRLSSLPAPGEVVSPGEFLGEVLLENVVDNAWTDFSMGFFEPGYYFIEVSNVTNILGWWGTKEDLHPELAPVENRVAKSSLEFNLRIRGVETYEGDWTLTLNGNRLSSRFAAAPATPASAARTRMISDWDNTGYDLDDFPFKGFHGSTGQFILANQLKRRPHMPQAGGVSWLHAIGKDGRDLRFGLFGGTPRVLWEMEPDALHWILSDHRLDLTALSGSDGLPTSFPRFVSSDEEFTDLLTDFLLGHGFNLGAGTSTDWKEWQSLILGWTDNPSKHAIAQQVLGYNMTDEGYVYTWGAQIGWPFPYKDEDGDGVNDYDTRHFTTNANLISGISRHVAWTRDTFYLRQALPRARIAMEYQLGPLQGAGGLLIGNSAEQTGRNGDFGGNYWDILPFGHKDAFANIYFYNSLARMAELELMAAAVLSPSQLATAESNGPPGRSPDYYRSLMETVRQRFTETFWLESEGRFAGCVDIDGVVRDYGFTFINLEALAYGLGTEEQAARIFHWLENGTTSSGAADIYSRWIFAPRSTTIHNPPNSGPQTPRPTWYYSGWGGAPWETQVQDGGTILYISGYDLLARSRFLGAENVDRRMRAIVDRYAMPDRLMGGSPLYLGERTQGGPGGGAGAVGVEGEFPESGLAPAAFLRTVLGIEARPNGLHVKPELPASLEFAGVENLSYAGELWNVSVTRNQVVIEPVNGDEARIGYYTDEEPFIFQPWLPVSPEAILEDTFQHGEAGTGIAGRPTSDGKAFWQSDGSPGADVSLEYAEEGDSIVFAPFSGEGLASAHLDHDVDSLPSYSVFFGRLTLRGFSFGSNLLLSGRKGNGGIEEEEYLRFGYELRPSGGTVLTGPDFWALWFRPGDGSDLPVTNITGSTVTFRNLELRVVGDRQRLYEDGRPLDPSWRPTQNRAGDGQADRAFQVTLNTSPAIDSYTHPIFNDMKLVETGRPRLREESLIAYEGFEYPSGNILGRDGGIGWSAPYAGVGSRPSPILESPGMEFEPLVTRGGALRGEGNASAIREIATGDLHPERLNAAGRIGKAGSEAWVSLLAQGIAPIQSRLWNIAFYRDTSQFFYLGKAGGETTQSWRLHTYLNSGETGYGFTGVPYAEPGLWVMHFDFTEDGEHTIRLFRDPDPEEGPPPAAVAVAAFNRTNLSFNRLRINAGDGLRVDEIRIGSSWEAVMPLPLTGYEAWRRDHFTEAELADETISGDAADPWGAGVPNLMRYAFGIDEPGAAGRDRLPVFGVEPDGGELFLTLTFIRGEGRSDVNFEVEAGSEVDEWRTDAVRVRQETLEDGSVAETYRDAEPIENTSRRFMRVRVSRQ